MKTITRLVLSSILVLGFAGRGAALTPVALRCDYAFNPLGVDSQPPRLFWQLESRERAQKQTAYEILVSSSAKRLAKNQGDLWDSGKVNSDETIQIDYAGEKLDSVNRAQTIFKAGQLGYLGASD